MLVGRDIRRDRRRSQFHCLGQRPRHDTGIGSPRCDHLRRLRHVFPEHDPPLHQGPKPVALQHFSRALAIGRMLGIGDGKTHDAAIGDCGR